MFINNNIYLKNKVRQNKYIYILKKKKNKKKKKKKKKINK